MFKQENCQKTEDREILLTDELFLHYLAEWRLLKRFETVKKNTAKTKTKVINSEKKGNSPRVLEKCTAILNTEDVAITDFI